jgi:hypothetical protein
MPLSLKCYNELGFIFFFLTYGGFCFVKSYGMFVGVTSQNMHTCTARLNKTASFHYHYRVNCYQVCYTKCLRT